MSRKVIYFLSFFTLFGLAFILAGFANAQGLDVGIDEIEASILLSQTDPIVIAVRVINFILLFLGILAVGLVLWAGFLWMTSGGSEDKIDQAKKILKNGIIGLIIVLSAWGIATFVLTKLMDVTGGGGGLNINNNHNTGSLVGTGALGACTVERVYPEPRQKDVPRNTSIILTFKEEIALNSVCQDAIGNACDCSAECNLINPLNIRIFESEFGDDCDDTCPIESMNVSEAFINASADRKTFIITPSSLLGRPDGNTDYSVLLTNNILKDEGESIFKTCQNDFFQWSFEVSNQLDLTPPQVRPGGVFPIPDDEKDIENQVTEAISANALVTVQGCPNLYQAATVVNVIPTAGAYNASAIMDSAYHMDFEVLSVVSTINNDQAQLFAGSNLLGVAAWNGNEVSFPGFFTLVSSGHEAGSAWDISIQPEIVADRLFLGTEVYIFSDNAGANNILIDIANCSPSIVANAIYAGISAHPDVNVDKEANIVYLSAKTAGAGGNSIYLNSNNQATVATIPFSGGQNRVSNNEVKHRRDKPMNSVIQINFNEVINPLLVSGSADAVSQNIKVVNNKAGALEHGAVCSNDSDCLSYKCSSGFCESSYLSGKFEISNMYKTVEFISDVECGQNGCGEKIYCLPANSNLSVRLRAADLQACTSNSDCSLFAPFSYCGDSNSFDICQDLSGHNYPVADINMLNGITDAALNSFDGNRDSIADGPFAFYNQNIPQSTERDNYKWSFYINDQIMSDPPQISFINPENGLLDADTILPVQINFNTLMMNSTLKTGSIMINNGQEEVKHRLLNLFTTSPFPLGYWVSSENKDVMPLDGEPDKTFTSLNHTELNNSVSYKAQVGSGVKDIYQNCFKPSAGPECAADELNPSCCYGSPTAMLGLDGNCQ
jgi:hypothetical protein